MTSDLLALLTRRRAISALGDQAAVRLAVAWARRVQPMWQARHPADVTVARALEAADAWLDCPCVEHSNAASAAAGLVEAAAEAEAEATVDTRVPGDWLDTWAAGAAAFAARAVGRYPGHFVHATGTRAVLADPTMDLWRDILGQVAGLGGSALDVAVSLATDGCSAGDEGVGVVGAEDPVQHTSTTVPACSLVSTIAPATRGGAAIAPVRQLRTDEQVRTPPARSNIDAMELAVEETAAQSTITVDRLVDIHEALMRRAPKASIAGRVRDVQSWIGGNDYNPCGADSIPPGPEHVAKLLADLCAFCNSDHLPPLIQAAVAHAQFETIHPFEATAVTGPSKSSTAVAVDQLVAAGILLPLSESKRNRRMGGERVARPPRRAGSGAVGPAATPRSSSTPSSVALPGLPSTALASNASGLRTARRQGLG